MFFKEDSYFNEPAKEVDREVAAIVDEVYERRLEAIDAMIEQMRKAGISTEHLETLRDDMRNDMK